MGKIFIESKDIGASNYEHTYLVYQDDNGIEHVIRGGNNGLHDPTDPDNLLGPIVLEINVPIEDSKDARLGLSAIDRGQVELDLQGRSAEDVWLSMIPLCQDSCPVY